jgi:hypothetical protein
MQLTAQVLMGSTQMLTTKKGDQLLKTKLKLIDIGPEASGGDLYWIDFLGEAALSEEELHQVSRQQVVVDVRRMYASAGKQPGQAYLNASGGAVRLNGTVIQPRLRSAGGLAQPRAAS